MELDPCDHNHTSIQLHTLMIQYTLKSLGKQMNRGMKDLQSCLQQVLAQQTTDLVHNGCVTPPMSLWGGCLAKECFTH